MKKIKQKWLMSAKFDKCFLMFIIILIVIGTIKFIQDLINLDYPNMLLDLALIIINVFNFIMYLKP